jgi:ethanolamine ammonia-lyase small subunit
MSEPPSQRDDADAMLALRRLTPARIGLGRAGFGLPVKAHLAFQVAHARARDAVHAVLDVDALVAAIAACGWPVCKVRSATRDRQAFLRQPDLGRTLSDESRAALSVPMVAPDVVFVLGDGLSSLAVERNAIPVLKFLWPRLIALGLRLAPIVVATQARVALADDIGELMQARLSVMMIGERPGLSAADSLGLYLTYAPRVGRVDAERNCISNVRAQGLGAEAAAAQAFDLIKTMLAARASGVALSRTGLPR